MVIVEHKILETKIPFFLICYQQFQRKVQFKSQVIDSWEYIFQLTNSIRRTDRESTYKIFSISKTIMFTTIILIPLNNYTFTCLSSSVGYEVDSHTEGRWFESAQQLMFFYNFFKRLLWLFHFLVLHVRGSKRTQCHPFCFTFSHKCPFYCALSQLVRCQSFPYENCVTKYLMV